MTLFRLIGASVAALAVAVPMLSVTVPASAQGTAEERSACMGDAFRFCSGQIPDVAKIEACLKTNVVKLTPACRAEFQPGEKTKLRRGHFQ